MERRVKRLRLFIVAAAVLSFSLVPFGRLFWKQALALSGFSSPWEYARPSLVRVHVLDVGKADAIVLESEGCTALLDAGTYADGEYVADYLLRQGISALDFAIMSHPDSDHIGGMAQVMEEIPAALFLRGGEWTEGGAAYDALSAALERRQVPQQTLSVGDSFPLGYAFVQVLGPLRVYDGTNNNSLVLKLCCGDFSALLCGDMEEEAELDLVKSGQGLSAQLLKVPHHGSDTSTTRRFVQAVRPQVAVISVGPDSNGLPREGPLSRLEDAGARIYRTDLDGDIIFSFDGETIFVDTVKQN